MLTTLHPLLTYAVEAKTAIAAINVFGYEDAAAVIEAAESANVPVILAASKDAVEFMPLKVISQTLLALAEQARVPVCVHLDHCYDQEIVRRALNEGFTSVMFDGSQLPLSENIAKTAAVVEMAKPFGASVEGEIGSVSYYRGRDSIKHELTQPETAADFYRQTGIDILAVSVGNVHRLESAGATIDFSIIRRISELCPAPLCIHGVSGIPDADLRELAVNTATAKLNVATRFRMVWGQQLRRLMNEEPEEFDRIHFMQKLHPLMVSNILSFFSLIT